MLKTNRKISIIVIFTILLALPYNSVSFAFQAEKSSIPSNNHKLAPLSSFTAGELENIYKNIYDLGIKNDPRGIRDFQEYTAFKYMHALIPRTIDRYKERGDEDLSGLIKRVISDHLSHIDFKQVLWQEISLRDDGSYGLRCNSTGGEKLWDIYYYPEGIDTPEGLDIFYTGIGGVRVLAEKHFIGAGEDVPAGSIPGVFEYLCGVEGWVTPEKIAYDLGLSTSTIGKDLWALVDHLKLVNRSEIRGETRYFVSLKVRPVHGAILKVLKQFRGKFLRPLKGRLQDVYREEIGPLIPEAADDRERFTYEFAEECLKGVFYPGYDIDKVMKKLMPGYAGKVPDLSVMTLGSGAFFWIEDQFNRYGIKVDSVGLIRGENVTKRESDSNPYKWSEYIEWRDFPEESRKMRERYPGLFTHFRMAYEDYFRSRSSDRSEGNADLVISAAGLELQSVGEDTIKLEGGATDKDRLISAYRAIHKALRPGGVVVNFTVGPGLSGISGMPDHLRSAVEEIGFDIYENMSFNGQWSTVVLVKRPDASGNSDLIPLIDPATVKDRPVRYGVHIKSLADLEKAEGLPVNSVEIKPDKFPEGEKLFYWDEGKKDFVVNPETMPLLAGFLRSKGARMQLHFPFGYDIKGGGHRPWSIADSTTYGKMMKYFAFLEKIRREYGLADELIVTVHPPYEFLSYKFDELMEAYDLKGVKEHTGIPVFKRRSIEEETLEAGNIFLKKLGKEIEKNGWKIKIGVENQAESSRDAWSLGWDIGHFRILMKDTPDCIQLTFDVGHRLLSPETLVFRDFSSFARKTGKHLVNIHFHENDGWSNDPEHATYRADLHRFPTDKWIHGFRHYLMRAAVEKVPLTLEVRMDSYADEERAALFTGLKNRMERQAGEGVTGEVDLARGEQEARDLVTEIRAQVDKAMDRDEKIIIGIDTSWIPEEQQAAIQGLLNRLTYLNRIRGLNNIIIRRSKNASRLAGRIAKDVDQTGISLSNVLILGDKKVLEKKMFNRFKASSENEESAFFAELLLPERGLGTTEIKLLDMLRIALREAFEEDGERSHEFTLRSDPVDIEELTRLYNRQREIVTAA